MYFESKLITWLCLVLLVNCYYNENLAKKLLYLSSAAYSNSKNQKLCLGSIFNSTSTTNSSYRLLISFEEICDDAGNTCSGFIVESSEENNIYFVFSGTHSTTQLLIQTYSSLRDNKDFYGIGQVMDYFKNAHDVLWKHIKSTLVDPKFKNYTLIFTGHSLGGSLATLAAAHCALIGYCSTANVNLYTFGEPRTGSVKFSKSLDILIGENFRVVHRYDIVPEVPACRKTGGILSLFFNTPCSDRIPTNPYHHGTEIWYNDQMIDEPYVTCSESTSIHDCPFSMQYINVFLLNGAANIEKHKHYFDVVVTNYGETGCTDKSKTFY